MKRNGRTDFAVKQIADATYMISDFGIANCYLLVGEKRALLIDVGVGLGDMRALVRSITDLPLDVVGTHAHVDHIGGCGGWDKIYLHRVDADTHWEQLATSFVRRAFLIGSKGVVDKSIKQSDLTFGKKPEFVPIDEGFVFDLGKRQVKVLLTPGHTVGSITLLDDKSKIAFCGDDMCPSPWLFLPYSTSVERWIETARRIVALTDEYTVYWSHEGGILTKELMERVITIGEEVLSKYKRNRVFSRVEFYPCNDRVNGSLVFRTGHVYDKKKEKYGN